ncbi:hypothetical protein RF11_15004 [Thelohanellus kitauei]|uniref:Uncharacterized protein n=1 Tax=Thelohanellus kitauei TaxID=669202 RepID=A0A0C2M9U6_THEKT|nr:hypothetical protein RF11_15004 [Thelohanellus kitauei]
MKNFGNDCTGLGDSSEAQRCGCESREVGIVRTSRGLGRNPCSDTPYPAYGKIFSLGVFLQPKVPARGPSFFESDLYPNELLAALLVSGWKWIIIVSGKLLGALFGISGVSLWIGSNNDHSITGNSYFYQIPGTLCNLLPNNHDGRRYPLNISDSQVLSYVKPKPSESKCATDNSSFVSHQIKSDGQESLRHIRPQFILLEEKLLENKGDDFYLHRFIWTHAEGRSGMTFKSVHNLMESGPNIFLWKTFHCRPRVKQPQIMVSDFQPSHQQPVYPLASDIQ